MLSTYDPKKILHLDQTDVEQLTLKQLLRIQARLKLSNLWETPPQKRQLAVFAGSIWLFIQFIHPAISTKNNELDCHVYFDQTPPYSLS